MTPRSGIWTPGTEAETLVSSLTYSLREAPLHHLLTSLRHCRTAAAKIKYTHAASLSFSTGSGDGKRCPVSDITFTLPQFEGVAQRFLQLGLCEGR